MIGVCGYGNTGSTAFTDLLKEYDGVKVLDKKEFVLTYHPDGFEDLEYHLMFQKSKFFSSDIGIIRFKNYMHNICHNKRSYYYKLTDGHFNQLIEEYIKKITQIKYKGRWMYDDYTFNSLFGKIIYAIKKKIKILDKSTLRDMYFSIEPECFYYETSKLLKKIYNYNDSNSLFVLDQPFPGNNPLNSMRLYGEDAKAIVVLRDPRDLYLYAKEYVIEKWVPTNDVYEFLTFYKKQFMSRPQSKNIMYVYFEDLVFDYDITVEKIEKFCGLSGIKHINKLKYFNPNLSLKNTKLFIKNKKYENDIRIIEEEMSEYLYDFSRYDAIDLSEEVF